ncbi:hypothetical protein C9J12_21330 [Photobacterium frigidiphilum]|uniref:N-acetyltransferase n=1 Tax=Photobacterium frigidiphilum TaxID=264736 RepID=A0A2T3JAG7_9GAMM|nr:hypothetical protein [Photobacterium frigidiphilum]PSU45784.1 hypothetical protein C9J12_21330 [Photobacterium frigidiphilum]
MCCNEKDNEGVTSIFANRILSYEAAKTAEIKSKPGFILNIPPESLLTVSLSAGNTSKKRQLVRELANDFLPYQEEYFIGMPIYELWLNHELIGLCHLNCDIYVTDIQNTSIDEPTLFLSLETVFIKAAYRHKGLGSYFCDVIRSELGVYLIASAYEMKSQKDGGVVCPDSCQIILESTFDSEGGERFYRQLFSDFKTYVRPAAVLKSFGFTLSSVVYDASYNEYNGF